MGRPHGTSKYSLEDAKLVFNLSNNGYSNRNIQSIIGIPKSTVSDLIRKYKDNYFG